MAVTLRYAVGPTQALLDVSGIEEATLDQAYLLDDEAVIVRGTPSAGGKLLVARGALGTERAEHATGATLVAIEGAPGGLPAQWTVSEDGSIPNTGDGGLLIELDTAGSGLAILAPGPEGSQFNVDLQALNPKVSFASGVGGEARVESDGSLYLYGRDDAIANPWLQMFLTDGEGGKQPTIDVRSDHANRLTIKDDDLNAVFQVREDGSIRLKSDASILVEDGDPGGDVSISAGTGTGDVGGNVEIASGSNSSGDAPAGITLAGADHGYAAGGGQLYGGVGVGVDGGFAQISGGSVSGVGSTGASMVASGGFASGRGGVIDQFAGNAGSGSDQVGGDISLRSGSGDGSGRGGNASITGGNAGADAREGASIVARGADGTFAGSAIIAGGTGRVGQPGGAVSVTAGISNNDVTPAPFVALSPNAIGGDGGVATVRGGEGTSGKSGASATISGGKGNASASNPGYVQASGGTSGTAGGGVLVVAGNSDAARGGTVAVSGGNSPASDPGGDVTLHGGLNGDSRAGGEVRAYGANAVTAGSATLTGGSESPMFGGSITASGASSVLPGDASMYGGDDGGISSGAGAAVTVHGGHADGGGASAVVAGGDAHVGSGQAGGDINLAAGLGDGAGRRGQIVLLNAPVADPHVVGAVWNNAGTLKISAG